jgi:hypothetical protein
MTIECGITGRIPYDIAPGDEFQVTFDISSWLNGGAISSVAYSAVDEDGVDATALVLDAAEHDNTDTVIKPYVKGGGTDLKEYTVKCDVTTLTGYVKAFYVKYAVKEIAA